MKKRMTAVAVAVVIAISGGLLYTAKNIGYPEFLVDKMPKM